MTNDKLTNLRNALTRAEEHYHTMRKEVDAIRNDPTVPDEVYHRIMGSYYNSILDCQIIEQEIDDLLFDMEGY